MNLWTELQRRNVFRVAGAYAVVGWLLAQVASLLESALGLPSWFDAIAVTLILLGAPAALVMAWAFELTPEGVKLTASAAAGSAPSRFARTDVIIVAALAVLIGISAFQAVRPRPAPAVADVERPADASEGGALERASIAVLPFADLSPEGDQGYFADGVAEEILDALADVDGLKVASRTSSFAFKGQEDIGVPAIAAQLHVRHILEGSVRKAGDRVRVTAQLIDTQTDRHLWSLTFDRTLTTDDIFAIQDEIANAVLKAFADATGVEGAEPQTVIEREPDTQQVDAYEKYLEANARFVTRGFDNIQESFRLFRQVIEIDPGFARAWAGLAAVSAISPGWGFADRDYYAISVDAAEHAIALNPELSMAYAAEGEVYAFRAPQDFNRAMELFDKAVELDPSNATARLWRGEVLVVLGYFPQADADLEACLELDPAYRSCQHYLATSAVFRGDMDRARERFDRLLESGFNGVVFSSFFDLTKDDQSELLWLLRGYIVFYLGLQNGAWAVEPLYRAATDPDYDRVEGLRLFEARLQNSGVELRNNETIFQNFVFFLFGAYDRITPETSNFFHWHKRFKEPENLAERRRMIEALNLPAYWRAHGFPPQCHAVGDDDYACD